MVDKRKKILCVFGNNKKKSFNILYKSNINIIALITITLSVITSTSLALSQEKISVGGALNLQYGYIKLNSDHPIHLDTNAAIKNKNQSLLNNIKINIKFQNTINFIKYGGSIIFNTDTSQSKSGYIAITDHTMLFLETKLGRFEIGSNTGAAYALKVNAANFAAATGGIDSDGINWYNNNFKADQLTTQADISDCLFLYSPNIWSNDIAIYKANTKFTEQYFYKLYLGGKRRNSNKLTYFSPTFSGLRFGISYIPDSSTFGTTLVSATSNKKELGFRNIIQIGIQYAEQLNLINFKAALIGECGKAVYKPSKIAKNKLLAWEFGFNAAYMGIIIGGSYGNLGRSGLDRYSANTIISNHNQLTAKKSSSYWTAGIGYNFGPFASSLTYLKSQKSINDNLQANSLQNLVLGIDYKLFPGFLPYMEIAFFKAHQYNNISHGIKRTIKGILLLGGGKLKF